MLDVLIRNGWVVDGSGSAGFTGDVAVKGGKITAVVPNATRIIDATGLVVAPGFIDAHRHADAAVFRPGFGEIELRQGITTIINGNCGLSIAPCPSVYRKDILAYLQPVTGTLPNGTPLFDIFSSYMNALGQQALPLNVGTHVGNGTLRMAAAGFAPDGLTAEQVKQIQVFLLDALDAGAFGVSLGLIYAPECYYRSSDIIKVLQPIAGTGVPLVAHVRGEGDTLLNALEEAVTIAKGLRTPLHISHFKCVGRFNWHHKRKAAFALLEKAKGELYAEAGIGITCDAYPWEAGATQLMQILPPEFLQGGMEQIIKRLRDSHQRRQCRIDMETPQEGFESLVTLIGWENIIISAAPETPDIIGKTIAAISAEQGVDPFDCAFGLIDQNNGNVGIINFITHRDDIDAILRRADTCVVSDSLYADGGRPHPRVCGTFPLLFEEYVRNRQVLSLESAVHKCTGLPAGIFNIKHKGLIREGYDANLVIFDPNAITNHASYTHPVNPPSGIAYVIVNGNVACENGRITHSRAGNVIKRR
jgi:N-acyl-D-aspartate/D-glutamate deacylase